MTSPTFRYDQVADTLYVSFAAGEAATGIELNQHLLLRINRAEERPVGLTIFDYKTLSKQTEMGPRSYPLDGLSELTPELQKVVLGILLSEPVSTVLAVFAYSVTATEAVPITSLRPLPHFQAA